MLYSFQCRGLSYLFHSKKYLLVSKWLNWNELKVKVTQSFLTLCDPMDHSLPVSSVHGILQARILEWVAVPFSRGFSQPRDQTQVSRIAGRHFNLWATKIQGKKNKYSSVYFIPHIAVDYEIVELISKS